MTIKHGLSMSWHATVFCLVLWVGELAAARPAPFEERQMDAVLFDRLQQGGFVLFLRHGLTDASQPDRVPVDLQHCASQRPLSEAGHQQMMQIGGHLRQTGWPVGEIYVSPFCRTQDSARAIFGQTGWVIDPLLMYTAGMSRAEKAPVIARTAELMQQPVPAGENRFIVAHGPNLAETLHYFPPEGTLVILEPQADAWVYHASIRPEQWPPVLGWARRTRAEQQQEQEAEPLSAP